jgi:acid stress chaperone HdeB
LLPQKNIVPLSGAREGSVLLWEPAAGHAAANAIVAFGAVAQSIARWEPLMNKFNRVLLALPLMALAILPARAQVTIDVSKITCEQYVLFTVADPRDIAMGLSGYFNSKANNTVLDTQKFRDHARQVMDYCQQNFKTPVMEAAQKVLGLTK